jgi:hypothetical protein
MPSSGIWCLWMSCEPMFWRNVSPPSSGLKNPLARNHLEQVVAPDLGTGWSWVVSFTPLPHCSLGKVPLYPLNRMTANRLFTCSHLLLLDISLCCSEHCVTSYRWMKLTGRWIKHIVLGERDLVIIVVIIIRAWKLQQVTCLLGARCPCKFESRNWIILTSPFLFLNLLLVYFISLKKETVGLWYHHSVCVCLSFQVLIQLTDFRESLRVRYVNVAPRPSTIHTR